MPVRITADTNVLVSATLYQGDQYKLLQLAKTGKIDLVLSLNILKEFKEVISRPRFKLSEEQIGLSKAQFIAIKYQILVGIIQIQQSQYTLAV